MKINFNTAQLSRPQRESLLAVLDVLQSENQNEIEVTPIEFPLKLKVKLDDDIEMLLGWDPETDGYAGLTTPETVANGVLKRALDRVAAFREKPNPVEPEPESQKDTVDLPEPEPEPSRELVMSEVGKRVQALAQALVNLSKPLGTYQRGEIWMQFCNIYVKELMK